MGKFYISLLAASLFATTTFAQSFQPKANGSEFLSRTGKVATADELNEFMKQGHKYFGKLDVRNISPVNSILKAKGAAAAGEPITEQPEGTLIENAYSSAHGNYVWYTYVYQIAIDGGAVNMVETDDNLYLYNPISTLITKTWLKGDKVKAAKAGDPDTVKIQLPTPVYKTTVRSSTGEDSVAVLYLQNLELSADGKTLTPAKDQVATYSWDGDTLRSLKKYTLGLVNANGGWYGYGDDSLVVFKQKDVATTLPEGATLGQYNIKYYSDPETKASVVVEGARVGDDLYLGGLTGSKNLYAKGTFKDGKLVFPKQYLGVDTASLFHTYYVPAEVGYTYDEYWGTYNASFEELPDGLSYIVDSKTNKYSAEQGFVINHGKYSLSGTAYNQSVISEFKDVPRTPKEPEIAFTTPYSDVIGYGKVKFTLSFEDAEGNILDQNKLYYQIFINKDASASATPYMFTKSKYKYLTEDTDLIPATFRDSYDFQGADDVYVLCIGEPGFSDTSVGVKAVYKGGNETRESAIAWDLVAAGINGAISDNATTKSVTYYDLSGRRTSATASGLYIKTVKLSDGTVKSIKVMRP